MISVNLNLQNFKNASWNKIKTQGKKLKIQEKTQNSRKKLNFSAFLKTVDGRKTSIGKACVTTSFGNFEANTVERQFKRKNGSYDFFS